MSGSPSGRFLVLHCPVDETIETQAFQRKGLAFAYAKRKLPKNCAPIIAVEQQVGDGQDPSWTTINRWTFHLNGDIEHSRL